MLLDTEQQLVFQTLGQMLSKHEGQSAEHKLAQEHQYHQTEVLRTKESEMSETKERMIEVLKKMSVMLLTVISMHLDWNQAPQHPKKAMTKVTHPAASSNESADAKL